MKYLLATLAFALLSFPGAVGWAQNTVPNFSHGPTASALGVRFENVNGAIDSKFSMLSEGLGYSFNLNNIVSSSDGAMSWIGFKVPVYPKVADSEFSLALGGELSFFNNLLGFGAAVNAIDTATDTGFILGDVNAHDVLVTVSVGFNLGSGAARSVPATTNIQAAEAIAAASRPPFNFVDLRR